MNFIVKVAVNENELTDEDRNEIANEMEETFREIYSGLMEQSSDEDFVKGLEFIDTMVIGIQLKEDIIMKES